MTDEQLAAIEARVTAATPGEWRSEWATESGCAGIYAPVVGLIAEVFGPSDEAFIREAHRDIPALVTALRELRAAARAVVARLVTTTGPDPFGGERRRFCSACRAFPDEPDAYRHADDCPVARLAALVVGGE